MMAQVFAKGFRADILRRMLCFSLFWHALDIIWVALFTVVYLLGSAPHERSPRNAPDMPTSRRAMSGRRDSVAQGIVGYLVGLGLAVAAHRRRRSSSRAPTSSGSPSIPVALVVLAIAQMGVHLVFFLHITTGAGQHQQRAGPGLRRPDRRSC